jgi:hypothetical protein
MSIRLYAPRFISRFHLAKTVVVLRFIMPPREETRGRRAEREVAAWAVADLVVGNRVDGPVHQPGRILVLLREAGGTGVVAV